ncbi:MAG TPA: hypothetical protein VFI06_16455 [Chitinophagaceae bacterium]|nr:hypothetical protein [Chitinophagaceae bacterium]
MKRIIITLAIALGTLSSFAAGEETVTSKVLNAFEKDFVGAKETAWTTSRDYYKAAFVFNGQHVSAFYSVDGEMIAMTRFISSLDLPLSLQTNLKKEYGNYWISDLFELSNSEGTNYYITLENADTKVVLKSGGSESWNVYRKSTKI